MKNLVVTLDINYPKEITDLTFPYMQEYAKNIGADFQIITERKYPELPIPMEKFQLYDVCNNYEWTIFLDADDLINPQTINLTNVIENDTTIVSEYLNFNYNPQFTIPIKIHCPFHFLAFHKNLKKVVMPKSNPLSFTKNISIKKEMINSGKEQAWHLDEFILAKNIEEFKIATISLKDDIITPYGLNVLSFNGNYLTVEQKVSFLKENIKRLQNMSNVQAEYT